MTQHSRPAGQSVPTKWLSCNGRQLRKLTHAGLTHLEANYQRVNELNVFPVPDGDTGTNMLLTMRSACKRVENGDELHVGKVAQELAQGALMGARGNSGVILSQILRGLAKSLRDKESFNAQDLAAGLVQAADTAYAGVMRPVEGTILSVIRAGAKEAQDAAAKSSDLRFVLERVLERTQQALEQTPEQLPILKQAGVVDSGGQGLVYIFEGMLRYVHGHLTAFASPAAAGQPVPAQALAVPEDGLLENPYDVQFILLGRNLDVNTIRDTIDRMGDSTVVVGDETTIKVHVHVKDPGQPISYGISLGHITDVVVENMQQQMEEIVGGSPTSGAGPSAAPEEAPQPRPDQIGVVAVAAGDGLGKIFRSLGAASVVNGGQTNNPSTEELLRAIQAVPADRVIVLPNNKNIILAAEAARELSPKEVAVVPTRSIPQGISAMLGLNPDGELPETVAAMQQAAGAVGTGEITFATRSVQLDGVTVAEGEVIGLANGRLCAAGQDIGSVVVTTLQKLAAEDGELLSIYYGADVTPDEAATMAQMIAGLFPDLEVELLAGGQAHYFYIFGVE